jgi:gliding motility-associated-like protein
LALQAQSPCAVATDYVVVKISRKAVVKAGINAPVCAGSDFSLTEATQQFAKSVKWTTSGDGVFSNAGILNPVYKPGQNDIKTGKVVLTVTAQSDLPCSSSVSSIELTIIPQATSNAGPDAQICEGNTYQVSGAVATNAVSYLWSSSGTGKFSNPSVINPVYTPSSTDVINGSVILTLEAKANSPCGDIRDVMVLTISAAPLLNAGPDITTCFGNLTVISEAWAKNTSLAKWTTTGKGSILSPGSVSATYKPAVNESGTVKMILSATGLGGCSTKTLTDTMTINILKPLKVNAGKDLEIMKGTKAILSATVENGSGDYSYKWTPSPMVYNSTVNRTETLPLDFDATFIVMVTDTKSGCMAEDTVKVTVKTRIEDILNIPNGISPNGDGANDGWWINGIELFPENEVLIFNRWGDKVNEMQKYDNVNVFWNGTNKQGKPLPDGTYYYLINIKYQKSLTGWVQVKKGSR